MMMMCVVDYLLLFLHCFGVAFEKNDDSMMGMPARAQHHMMKNETRDAIITVTVADVSSLLKCLLLLSL
jgi:hypothetical protein